MIQHKPPAVSLFLVSLIILTPLLHALNNEIKLVTVINEYGNLFYSLDRSNVLAASAARSKADESKRYASIALRSDFDNGDGAG